MEINNVFSVFEITRHLRQVIESSIEALYIKGEISNFVHHSSGHMYFNLKDEYATLRCTFFKNSNYRINFKPADGQSVVCFGKITLYEKAGTYNLNVSSMTPAGIGDMQARFEALKKKLEAEGLFDPAKKKKLPSYPQTIGIVTSPTSAALQDVMNILKRRFPVDAFVYPALVQGADAPRSLIKGIRYFNEVMPVDLIILTRGGGSQEDLFCFNDEALARAIFASKIALISAVGHEIDFSISDFVADLRAPTPSAAAEIAVPNKDDLLAYCRSMQQRLKLAMQHSIGKQSARMNELKHTLSMYHPERVWQGYQQRFDMAALGLKNTQRITREPSFELERIQSRLENALNARIIPKLSQFTNRLAHNQGILQQAATKHLETAKRQTGLLEGILAQQSPKTIMQKGWMLAMKDARLLRSLKDIQKGDHLELHLHDGQAGVVVESTKQDPQ